MWVCTVLAAEGGILILAAANEEGVNVVHINVRVYCI